MSEQDNIELTRVVNRYDKKINEAYKEGREDVQKEVESLRVELTKTIEHYTAICERLWNIAHKKKKRTTP